jgi:hypothetical protein
MQTNNIVRCALLATLLPLGSLIAFAQTGSASAEPDNLRAVLETLRSDVNSYKVRVINQAMQLTGPEAEKFWPIYRQYEQELGTVAGKKVALLREFADRCANGTLDSQAANKMAQQWLDNVQARLDLWKKYNKKIAKAVSPARAAQFLQVEHQVALFMDLNIASEMPALRTVIKTQ